MSAAKPVSQLHDVPQYWLPKVLAHARAVHQELLDLNEKIDTTFLEVGVRLKEIRDRHLYQPLNATSFSAYVKTLKFSRSRAYALVGVVEDFYLSSRLDKSRLLAIGWEKLSMLRTIKDDALMEVWLEKAQQLGKRQLRQALYQAALLPRPEEPLVEEEEEPEVPPAPAAPERTVEERPTYYLAIKKLAAVKLMSPEEVKQASDTGKYPLILAVEGSVYAQQTNLLGLPTRALKEDIPVLDPSNPSPSEDESIPE